MKKIIVFAKEINKISLSSTDDKRIQSIDVIETSEDGTSKDLVVTKKKKKLNVTI